MNCFHCRSNDLRLSRIHLHDIRALLLLKVPVRCRSCRERFYTALHSAWSLSGKNGRRRPKGRNIGGGSAMA